MARKKKVALQTMGCRLNFSETGSLAEAFVQRGYEIVPFGESADVTFLNTCTVTDDADSSCRSLIRKAYRHSPEGKIVVAGCYAQMDSEKVKAMNGVDLVLGTTEKYKVFEYLEEETKQQVKIDQSNEFWGAQTTRADSHTRAFLKIQDGCNYICSFCIIPFARGRSRAISVEDAVARSKQLVDDGFKEIVLTGVNIGEYENNTGERLSRLVAEVLKVKGLKRLRLSSVEPNTVTEDLLQVMSDSEKFMPHFHIPLQSGSDAILKKMRRKYNAQFYSELLLRIKEKFPTAGIGADMIAGFPGESDENFQETFHLAQNSPLTHFHVFPFSRRQGTTAARIEEQVSHDVKKKRVRALLDLGAEKLRVFSKSMLGQKANVLFEKRSKEGFWGGYTENYLRVFFESDEDLSNQILPVKMHSFSTDEKLMLTRI